ncbi:MAG: M1 family metallopeptidase [Acidobacteriota bacterium]
MRTWAALMIAACSAAAALGAEESYSDTTGMTLAANTDWLDKDPLAARLDAPSLTEALSPRNASYAIDVTLDTAKHTLEGHELVRYRNLASAPMTEIQLHLYLNAFKNPKSTFMRESGGQLRGDRYKEGFWGSTDIRAIKIAGSHDDLISKLETIHPDDDNGDDETVVRLPLPSPVAPREAVTLDITWDAKLPRVFARTGYAGSFHMVGQWFPKVGVYEVRDGTARWNCHQFHANSEFFSDYGIYDVVIRTAPDAVVGASGVRVEDPKVEEQLKVHHYRAEDVHDFAFTADPDFRERTERWNDVDVRVLYQPEHEPLAADHVEIAKASLKFFDEHYGKYPYRTLTVVDPGPGGGGAGGMEYPTLITAGTSYLTLGQRINRILGRPNQLRDLEIVIFHEFGHQYWYGLVGSNEFEEAWLDEGFNSYSETKGMGELYGPVLSLFHGTATLTDLDLERLAYAAYPQEGPILEKAWGYLSGTGYGIGSYMKPATVLTTLERLLGEETMGKVMRTYFETYRFHHPRSEDFFRVVNDVSGKDYGWFFDQFVRKDLAVDYAVRSVTSRKIEEEPGLYDRDGKRVEVKAEDLKKARREKKASGKKDDEPARYLSRITLDRRKDGIAPVDYEVRFLDGTVEKGTWDGASRALKLEYTRPAKVGVVVIDPEKKLLIDVNLGNNSMFAGGGESPFSSEARGRRSSSDDGDEAKNPDRDAAEKATGRLTAGLHAIGAALVNLLSLAVY